MVKNILAYLGYVEYQVSSTELGLFCHLSPSLLWAQVRALSKLSCQATRPLSQAKGRLLRWPSRFLFLVHMPYTTPSFSVWVTLVKWWQITPLVNTSSYKAVEILEIKEDCSTWLRPEWPPGAGASKERKISILQLNSVHQTNKHGWGSWIHRRIAALLSMVAIAQWYSPCLACPRTSVQSLAL